MGQLSGMEISSSPGLKIPQKLAHGQKFLPPKGRRPAGVKIFFPRANFWGLSTRGMKKISYLTTKAHSEIVFLFESIYAHPTLFSRILIVRSSKTQTNFKKRKYINSNSKNFVKLQWHVDDFFMGHAEIRFPHGPFGNRISFHYCISGIFKGIEIY